MTKRKTIPVIYNTLTENLNINKEELESLLENKETDIINKFSNPFFLISLPEELATVGLFLYNEDDPLFINNRYIKNKLQIHKKSVIIRLGNKAHFNLLFNNDEFLKKYCTNVDKPHLAYLNLEVVYKNINSEGISNKKVPVLVISEFRNALIEVFKYNAIVKKNNDIENSHLNRTGITVSTIANVVAILKEKEKVKIYANPQYV